MLHVVRVAGPERAVGLPGPGPVAARGVDQSFDAPALLVRKRSASGEGALGGGSCLLSHSHPEQCLRERGMRGRKRRLQARGLLEALARADVLRLGERARSFRVGT